MGFKEFLLEYQKPTGGGADAGHYEIVSTPVQTAMNVANTIYHRNHTKSPKKLFPNFAHNYALAQNLAKLGHTKRKDMPVIRRVDAFQLQQRLARGALDIKKPFAKGTDPENPFPEGLSGVAAQKFLTNGFRDGKVSDDVVKFSAKLIAAGSLKPIQQQIYLDKALEIGMSSEPAEWAKSVGSSFMISTSDGYIIDGHHRWLFSVLLDPNIKMSSLVIDLPLKVVLKLLTAYGDAIGNKRNL